MLHTASLLDMLIKNISTITQDNFMALPPLYNIQNVERCLEVTYGTEKQGSVI